MAKRNQHDNLVRIEQGKGAGVALAFTRSAVAELTDRIISSLVSQHRSGTSTEASLRGGVGEIAGLRNLIAHFENQVSKGFISTEEEVANGDESTEIEGS